VPILAASLAIRSAPTRIVHLRARQARASLLGP
jgi:hypothetical protein